MKIKSTVSAPIQTEAHKGPAGIVVVQPGEHNYPKLSLNVPIVAQQLVALRESGMISFDGDPPTEEQRKALKKKREKAAKEREKKIAEAKAEEAKEKAAKKEKDVRKNAGGSKGSGRDND